MIRIEDADHSLNIPGDLQATLNALHRVVDGVTAFIREEASR